MAWTNFIASTTMVSAEVNANFDFVETDIVPQIGGSLTADTYSLGTSSAKWLNLFVLSINTKDITISGTVQGYDVRDRQMIYMRPEDMGAAVYNTITTVSQIDTQGTVNFWPQAQLRTVNLRIAVAGNGNVGQFFSVRLTQSGTTIFETNSISVGNPSAQNVFYYETQVNTGNSTNLDLTTELLYGVNANSAGAKYHIEANTSNGTGSISVVDFEWLWRYS